MLFRDIFKLSTRMFRTHPSRTFLTILGMSVGIGAILFLVSLGYGLQKILLEQVTNDEVLLTLDVFPLDEELVSIDKKTLEEISKFPEVEKVSKMVTLSAQMNVKDITADVLIYAIDPLWFRLGGIRVKEGKIPSGNGEIVLSSITASLFNLTPKEIIGKKAKFVFFVPQFQKEESGEVKILKTEKEYKIVGIVEDEEINYVYFPLKELEKEIEILRYNQLKVKIKNNKLMEMARSKIVNMGFQVSAISDTIEQANKIFKAIQIALGIFGLVALIVAAIGMANTMTISLLERINEIGVMKAIGASEKDVAYLFLGEAVIMGFLGGVGGIIVGFVVGFLFNTGVNLLAKALGGQPVDLFYTPPWFLLGVVGLSIFVGFVTGIFPARRAARFNPLEALRYK